MLHTVFNIITTLILVWFCPQIAKLVSAIIRMPKSTEDQEVFRLKYIEGGPVSTAELSIKQALKETVHFGRISQKGLDYALKAVNSKTGDLSAALREFTGEFGADVVVEAVGLPRLLEESLGYAAPGGRIVVLGFNPEPAKIPEVLVVKKELKIIGSRMNCRKFPQVIEWFEKGLVNPEPLISAKYPFEKINDAFKDILRDPQKYLKVLITY